MKIIKQISFILIGVLISFILNTGCLNENNKTNTSSESKLIFEDNNFQIEYAVINTALCDIMRDNLGYEMKDIWKLEDGGDVS